MQKKDDFGLTKLIEIIERLRGEGGCPWDRAQDLNSIRENIMEEAREVVDAIDEGDLDHLKEELGDLLFLVLFATSMAKEKGFFDYKNVVRGISSKLIYRHPHVFGNKSADTKEEALSIWKEQKNKGSKNIASKRIPFFSIMIKLEEKIPLLLNENFDVIIGIKRGGIIPSSILAYKLDLPLSFIGLRLYEDGLMPKRIYRNPEVLDIPPHDLLRGKRILLVDDIENTGDTIKKAKEIVFPSTKDVKTFSVIGKHTDYYLFLKEGCVKLPWF